MKIIIPVLLLLSLLSGPLRAQKYELIPYRVKDKWGFVDSTQKRVIKPKYEDAVPFMFGRAAFKRDGKWGLINLQDEVVLAPKFDSVQGAFFDTWGEQAYLNVYFDNEWEVCDTNGIIHPDALVLEMEMDEGYYEDRTPRIFQENGLYGIKDYKSNVVIAPTNQKIVKPSEYDTYFYFKKNDKWGMINFEMKITIENKYDSLIDTFSGHIALLDGKMGLINGKGKTMLPIEHQSVSKAGYSGFYFIDQDGKMGYADRNGKVQIEPKHQNIIKHYEGLAYSFIEDGKWGYKDEGNGIFIAPKYKQVKEFQHGYAEVKTLKGKKGYINTEGVEFFKK